LIDREPNKYAETIVSLDKVLALRQPKVVPRTDLVLIAGNSPAKRKGGEANVTPKTRPAEYTAARDLQVVEVFIEHGEALIKSLYDSLWTGDTTHGKA
jgi:hypothetical protein